MGIAKEVSAMTPGCKIGTLSHGKRNSNGIKTAQKNAMRRKTLNSRPLPDKNETLGEPHAAYTIPNLFYLSGDRMSRTIAQK